MSEAQPAEVSEVCPTAPALVQSSASSENGSTVSVAASLQSVNIASKAETKRPTSLPKPSGLKPPSKIGRLCSNSAPKPAVPISPRSDCSSSDTVRKLSDDSSRKHLSDLIEADEDEVTSSLPDKPRNHRKASNHSVVLTEDTDSFIIGERVWVGGTKPGQIAYIGETQFAPGDWAGIVLDDPIGKNDGSVAGVRYFQCGERRGVFSRLTRLTRVPLVSHSPHDVSPVSDASSVFERPPSGMARTRRTLSPNGSVRSMVSSKMNASISTTTNGELRLGDRVIVSSSRGSKAGALRYVGVTDFAPGIWAGVELDDPLGKNDGSVEGKRYFECAPRFGLFAPIAKVTRSPSNRKPGACAIHSNGRATPLRRSNSRESLTSLGTSIASSRAGVRLGVTSLGAQRLGAPRATSTPLSAKNALQELLREKQHHLERLMRERELERAEVAKVSLQADRAENALALLKKEAAQTNDENEKLKSEVHKLNKLLEDEKQKVEDLMFRTEEENINKEDYNKYKEAMEQEKSARELRIRELEATVALQEARADATAAALLALEDRRSSEAAALSDQHKEELTAAHTLSSELQKLLDEAYALLKEKENEKDSIGKSMSEELTRVKAEAEKALNEAKTKMAIAQTEFETQLTVVTAKLQLTESKLESDKQNLEKLNKEHSQTLVELNAKLIQLQATVDDKTYELTKVLNATKEHEVSLNKEISKLRMELSAKVLDLEELDDIKRKQESSCKTLQEEIDHVKEDYTKKVNEYEGILNEMTQQNEKNKLEIVQLQQNLSAKTKEYEKLLSDSSSSNSSTEKLINEYKNTVLERDKEIIKLKDEYEQATASFNIKHSKIAEEHKKEIEERNSKIDELTKEIKYHKQTVDQTKIEYDTLNSQLTNNVDELRALKEENEHLKQTVAELTQQNNELKSKISSMELEIGELKRQYEGILEKCNELQKAKDKVETEYLNLTGKTTDSNDQFNKLSQHLKETETELQQMKDKFRESANTHGRTEQELKQQLFKLQEDFSLERSQLMRSIDENLEKSKISLIKANEFEVKAIEVANRLKELETSNDKLSDENSILKKDIEAFKIKEQELNSEYESMHKKLELDIEKYKEEVSLLKSEGVTSEVKLMEKVDQLTDAQNDLNNKLEEARKHEDSLQKIVDDMSVQLNNQQNSYENEIVQIKTRLTEVIDESNKLKLEESLLRTNVHEKENSIKELSLKLEMLEIDCKSNCELISEKDRQIIQFNEELSKTLESKKQLEEKLSDLTLETSTLKLNYDNLVRNTSAEESMLKEQVGQFEMLRKEMAVLVQDKSSLEDKCKETSNNLEKLKLEHEETLTKHKEMVNSIDLLKKALQEKECLLKSQNDKYLSDSNKVLLLQDLLTQLKLELDDKNNIIQDKEIQLSTLNNNLELASNDTQQLVNKLQIENTSLNSKYKTDIESLNKTIKTLESRVMEQDKQLEELQKTKERVTELQNMLDKSESDIKQLTNINEGQKCNYEDLNNQLQIQYDQYRKDSKQIKNELKSKIEEYKNELNDSKEKIKNEISNHSQLQAKLADADKRILELSNQLELVSIQQNSNVEKDERLEKLTLELQNTRQSTAEVITKSEQIASNLNADIEHKIKDLKNKDDLISKLQDEIKNMSAKVEILSREKALLQKELAMKGKENRDSDNNAVNIGQGDNAMSNRISEEKEMIDGQVSFLNSVIVDMQRKNEKLMARVQALEGGTAAIDTPLFNGRKPRAVAPRLFCDICDVFDAHDTEECPRQSAEPDAPAPPSDKKTPPPPRAYCDICEVFGHATENCDEEETF